LREAQEQVNPVSAPSMVNLSLNKGQDPEVWITESEVVYVSFDNMVSSISENQFMIHLLNNLPTECNL
jgi:hypothetical protein